jgi:mRNA interferase MazF
MQKGEIVLGYFPFGDAAAAKLRPLLLLIETVGTGTEVVAAYISSVIPSTLLTSDILLDSRQPQHQSTRLKVASVLRLHKIATVHTDALQRYIGFISSTVQQEVDAKLKMVLKL